MQRFRDSLIVNAPVEAVWNYYTDVRNLAELTHPSLGMRVVRADTPMHDGSRIRFALRPRGFPLEIRWDARITEFHPHRSFADKQVRGPFEHWVHRHEFHPMDDGRTELTDLLEVGAPMGLFGRVAESLIVGQKIEELFDHRRDVLERRFPPAG